MNQDTHKQRVNQQFGRSAGDYAVSDIHAHGESLAVLLELIETSTDWQMLDIATGAGHTALAFAPNVGQVVATDITQEMLDKTNELAVDRQLSNVTTQLADAESLPFDDSRFDLVTCRLAFHHFQKPDQSLAEFYRVLKPGGILGFTDNYTVEEPAAAEYYNRYEIIRDPSHHWVSPLSELKQKFVNAGFVIRDDRKLEKEFEFHRWADRQRVSDADKQVLLEMMREIPSELEPLFQPRFADGTMYFHLVEAVIVAQK